MPRFHRWKQARCLFYFFTALHFAVASGTAASRPNVVVIVTDDQGYGDLGFHGNPKIRTPNLDRFARSSVRFKHFYVSPVCSPTRASLLTGRYNYRTGVVDTYLGRSMMHAEEVTLPEVLRDAGYRTGIFGKWHLGDNYPMRPVDQGFQEALVHKGGGIGQPSDPPGGSSYFDPVLQHNGKPLKTEGYCSDVFTDAAMRFIEGNRERPFFVWLAFNAPHTPLQVPEEYYAPYREINLSHDQFPATGHPLKAQADKDMIAKVYGMVSNIDMNVGRLMHRLEELRLATNTLIIFLTDNGPQQVRYNAGMRERKGSVYEGGIRVPFFVRWPGRLSEGREISEIAAHIDLMPTLLEVCGVQGSVKMDGRSLWPLIKGDAVRWPDRTLYFQWHRGEKPELYRAFAARSHRYKLVQATGASERASANRRKFELFDMLNDPLEMNDIADENATIVEEMRRTYEKWFKDVSTTRGFDPPRIHIGSKEENPTVLTRQDWRGPKAGWTEDSLGHWEVQVEREAQYEIAPRFAPIKDEATIHFELGAAKLKQAVRAGETNAVFESALRKRGPGQLRCWINTDGKEVGVHYVEIKRL